MSTHWNEPLAWPIAPKSGPMRRMETLIDANRALRFDLPAGWMKAHQHWRDAGFALATAGYSGRPEHNLAAYELLVAALQHEGWMTRAAPAAEAAPHVAPDLEKTAQLIPFKRAV